MSAFPRTTFAAFLAALLLTLQLAATSVTAQEQTREEVADRAFDVELPENISEPQVAARAWVLVDAKTGKVLLGEGASERLPTGSTSKIMTALTALRMVESGEARLDDEVTVSERAAFYARPIYSNAGLQTGDVLSVRELLMATLIPSGNDAATALAEHLGGGGEEGIERFVERMNHEARVLGLDDSRFENVTGLDGRGHRSSAGDLAKMALTGLSYPLFAEIVATPEAVIETPQREIYLQNTNDLLYSYARATGVKTGTSPAAGPSLVASAAANDEAYIAVILDAREDRFAAALRVLEHGFIAYERPEIVREGERYARVQVPYRRDERIALVAARDVEGTVDGGSRIEREVSVMEELPAEARPGTRLGEVVVRVDGERVGEAPLVAKRGYDQASVWERVWYTVGGIFVGEEEG
ncbi:MAG: D-alanyl-D-alanine carboxypeptidase family protein [Actinomycetota bacterium]